MKTELQTYIDRLEAQDKAVGTIRRYTGALEAFSDWLDREDMEILEVTTRDIERYLSWLKNEQEYAPKTVRGYYSPVSGYYGDLERHSEIEEDPTEDVRLADFAKDETRKEQVTKEERIWLSKDEMKQLVENVPAPKVRNRLLILFQYYTGLRRQEVVDIRLNDLDREKRMVHVRGKGDKTHTAHWQPKLDSLLRTWLDMGYRSGSPYANESEFLFVSDAGPQLSADRLNKIVIEAAENAGIQEVLYEDPQGRSHYKYTSHVLRHSFAMHWLQNGGSIESLSKHMAHSSVTTTEIYGEILDERAKEEYQEYAPIIDF